VDLFQHSVGVLYDGVGFVDSYAIARVYLQKRFRANLQRQLSQQKHFHIEISSVRVCYTKRTERSEVR